jgi:hypothetical protein
VHIATGQRLVEPMQQSIVQATVRFRMGPVSTRAVATVRRAIKSKRGRDGRTSGTKKVKWRNKGKTAEGTRS